MKARLTKAAVEGFPQPGNGEPPLRVWDDKIPGFGVKVTSAGARIYELKYRVGRAQRWRQLGRHGEIATEEARREALRLRGLIAGGKDPAQDRDAAAARNTVSAIVERYLEAAAQGRRRNRPLSAEYLAETGRTLQREVIPILGERPVAKITRPEIRQLLDGILDRGSPSQANHTKRYLSAFFGWAVREEIVTGNPCIGLDRPAPEGTRERALDDDEIRGFWLACERLGWPFGPFNQLLLLTGQRRDELAEATWSEFDLDTGLWALPGSRTKNDRPHLVPLAPLAVEILRALPRMPSPRGLLFTTGRRADTPISGWSKATNRLRRTMQAIGQAEVPPFTRHDLRRTLATGMAALGVAPHVIDKILNHSTGRISGVALVYNRFEYLPERKAALAIWARHVGHLVRPAPSNVVELQPGAVGR